MPRKERRPLRINSDELAEYIHAVLQGIGKGISEEILVHKDTDTFFLSGPVKFRVGITNSASVGGEAKIFVVGLHGEKSNEQHAQIEFEVTDKTATLLTGIDKAVTIWEKLTKEEKDSVMSAVSEFLKVVGMAMNAQNAASVGNRPGLQSAEK
jgi:hypothetical protein